MGWLEDLEKKLNTPEIQNNPDLLRIYELEKARRKSQEKFSRDTVSEREKIIKKIRVVDKIKLADGKIYRIIRLPGNNENTRKLLTAGELDQSAPEYSRSRAEYADYKLREAPELTSMEHWFQKESGAMSGYMNTYVFAKNATVYFVLGKKNEPIAFFSLLKSKYDRGRLDLGAIYVKQKYRGLMGTGTLPKGIKKGSGHRLSEKALRIAKKSGYANMVWPEMNRYSENIYGKITEDPSMRKVLKKHRLQLNEDDSGPDAILELQKRTPRAQRRKTLPSKAFRTMHLKKKQKQHLK